MIMRKKKISVLEWESMVNTIATSEQEKMYSDVMNNDSIQSIKDTERENNEVTAIKQKYDRAYYAKNRK